MIGLGTACGAGEPSSPRDLLREVASARVQPAPTVEVVRQAEVTVDGASTPALILTSPARLTWSIRFPERMQLDASVVLAPDPMRVPAAGVTVRIGVSDDRGYDELLRLPIGPDSGGWQPIKVDLSAYSGWKWSLFYRPSRITWNLIVNADATPGGSIAWRELAVRPRDSQRR